jgi:hypothetical protein
MQKKVNSAVSDPYGFTICFGRFAWRNSAIDRYSHYVVDLIQDPRTSFRFH